MAFLTLNWFIILAEDQNHEVFTDFQWHELNEILLFRQKNTKYLSLSLLEHIKCLMFRQVERSLLYFIEFKVYNSSFL